MQEPVPIKQMAATNLGHAYMDQKETARFLAQQDDRHRTLKRGARHPLHGDEITRAA